MNRLLVLLALAGLGYLGYRYYQENPDKVRQKYTELTGREAAPADEYDGTQPPGPEAPKFESKIDAPPGTGEKQYAPPGVFYMVERVSAMTDSGVQAVNPGEEVRLLKRLGNGKMRVMYGRQEFEIAESQATNDLDIAREAEKRDFVARGGKL